MPVWDYLAPVREANELERIGPSVNDPDRLSILGSPGQWRTSPLSQWGLWADASEGRAFIKATQGDGNFLTQSINLISGVFGGEPNAVPIEDQRASAALLEVDINIPFSLAQKDIRPFYQERVDPNFNPVEELKVWKKDNPQLAGILDLKMPGLDDALKNTNNQEWFKYVINLSLARIQAEQKIEDRNRRIGTIQWLGEAAVDGFGNYLYKDPTFAPSLLFFGGAQGLKQGSVRMAGSILKASAKGGQPASMASRAAAGTIRYIGSAPAVAHGGLAARVGHATALGVELGAYGAALDTAAQLDMMRVWNRVFSGTDLEREFSYTELFLMSGLMGALGYGLGGAIGGFLPRRTAAVREGLVASTNGLINSRAARRGFSDPASAVIMQSDDMAQVSILNKLERLAASTDTDANDLYWLLDERFIRDEHGLLPHQLDDVLDQLLDVIGEGNITKNTLTEFMVDFLAEAGIHNQSERLIIPTVGPGAIRWRQLRHQIEEDILREGQFQVGSKEWHQQVHRRTAEAYKRDSLGGITPRLDVQLAAARFSTTENLTTLTDAASSGKAIPGNAPFIGTHQSSNLASFEKGVEQRGPGLSVARNKDETLSNPMLSEPKGQTGIVTVAVTGRGLDYNIPAHRKIIDDIIDDIQETVPRAERLSKGVDFLTNDRLRKLGFAWVNNFNGIGESAELHVINSKFIKVLSITPDVPVVKRSAPLNAKQIAETQEEMRELIRLQKTRGLTQDEESRMLRAENSLIADDIPEVARRNVDPNARIDPESEFTIDLFSATLPRAKQVMRLFKIRTAIRKAREELTGLSAAAKRAHGRGTRLEKRILSKQQEARNLLEKIGEVDDFRIRRVRLNARITKAETKLDRARESLAGAEHIGDDAAAARIQGTVNQREDELKAARLQMQNLAAEEGQTLAQIALEQASLNLQTRQGRIDSMIARKGASDVGSSQFITDINLTATLMRAWGLGDAVSFVALHKTGQPLTTRSMFAAVREAAAFVDNSKITVDAIGPSGPIHAGTLMDAKRNAEKLLAPLNGYIQSLFETGIIKNRTQWKQWQRDAVLHAHRLIESEDETIQKAVDMWRKLADHVAAEGAANGRLEAKIVEDFFPVRVLVGKLRRGSIEFHAALVKNWLRRWHETDDLNPDILSAIGLAKRTVTDRGSVKYTPIGDLAGLDDIPQQRGQLSPAHEKLYDDALNGKTGLNERGESAIEASAWRALNGMLDQKTYDQGKDGIIRFHEPVPLTAEFQRAIDPEMLIDPELEKFFDFNFMDVAYDYTRTTAFEVKAQTAVQRLTGVVGASVDEYFDAMQIVAEKGLRRGTDDIVQIKAGMNQLRSKWNIMRGRSPRYVAEAEGLGEGLAEAAIAGTTAVYGGGIGTLITFTEMFIQSFARIYRISDFWDNMYAMFRSISSDKFRREVLGDMATSLRLNRMTSAERFTSGAQGSNFHYRIRDKFAEPWIDFWDALRGEVGPGGRLQNRSANTVVSGIKAIGKTMLTGGGTDFMTNAARTMLVYTATRETAQFLPAALRMARLLEDRSSQLATLRAVTQQVAIDGGADIETAIRKSNTAYHKAWRSIAREAGFGGRWQIADRFARHGMLNSRKLEKFMEVGQASGAYSKKGNALDLTEMAMQLSELDKTDRFLVGEMINQVDNSIEDVMRKRVSEQGPLQTPTDAASLVYHGRALNAMFSFSRSFVDNNIIELAHLPQAEGMGLLTGFIVGETMGQVARQLLKGRSIDDLKREWDENPEAAMASYLLRVPLLGQATPILQTFADAALDGKRYRREAGQSAATSLQSQLLNLTSDAIAVPGELLQGERPRVITGLDRLSVTMLPGLGMIRRAMGDDSLDRVRGGVKESHAKYRQAVDYTKFREKQGGATELREQSDLFDIDDLIKQQEEFE